MSNNQSCIYNSNVCIYVYTTRSVGDTVVYHLNRVCDRWRKANGLDKMVLCGHSLGGYLSVCYAEKYPQRIEKLVLASPVR